MLGFVDGMGEKVGFADCISDIEKLFHDITAVVDFFQTGFGTVTISTIVKAFELIGGVLKDFAVAIEACAADATKFIADVKDVAAALSGDVSSVLKILVEEGIHIFRERKEITEDCKTTAADWRAGDYFGSGKAVGDIVGVIVEGL